MSSLQLVPFCECEATRMNVKLHICSVSKNYPLLIQSFTYHNNLWNWTLLEIYMKYIKTPPPNVPWFKHDVQKLQTEQGRRKDF